MGTLTSVLVMREPGRAPTKGARVAPIAGRFRSGNIFYLLNRKYKLLENYLSQIVKYAGYAGIYN